MDHPAEIANYGDGGYKAVVVCIILILMQLALVSGRCFARRLQKVLLEADDYVLLLATVSTFGLSAIAIAFPRIAAVGQGAQYSEDASQARLVGSSFIVWMVLYGASVALSKCAILLLYVRVFSTRNKVFKIAVYAVSFIVVATGLATVFGSIFQCTPVSRNWDLSVSGTCINKIQYARFTALPNAISGIVMLALPMPLIWQLNVTLQQKIALTATFLHGIIGLVASLARVIFLFEPDRTKGLSWVAISWTIWTVVEPANYVIAACLPTLRPVFVRILPPSFFLLTHKRSNKPYSSFKFSWPKGRKVPKISLTSQDIHGASHITGPWDSSRAYWEQDVERNASGSSEKSEASKVTESTVEDSKPQLP